MVELSRGMQYAKHTGNYLCVKCIFLNFSRNTNCFHNFHTFLSQSLHLWLTKQTHFFLTIEPSNKTKETLIMIDCRREDGGTGGAYESEFL